MMKTQKKDNKALHDIVGEKLKRRQENSLIYLTVLSVVSQ